MIDRLYTFSLGRLVLFLHHLNPFEIYRRNFAQACFVQSHKVGLLLLHDLFLEAGSEDVRRVWPLDVVQIVASQLLIIAVRFSEVVEPGCDLQLLGIELVVELLARFERIFTAICCCFDNTGTIKAFALLTRVSRMLRRQFIISVDGSRLGNRLLLLFTLLALLGELLEIDLVLARIVIGLHEGLHLGREPLCVLESIAALRPLLNLLLQALIKQLPQVVVRMLRLLVDAGAVVPPLAIFRHEIKRFLHEHGRPLVMPEIFRKQVDVRHGVTLLLVAGLVELPLVDVVEVRS